MQFKSDVSACLHNRYKNMNCSIFKKKAKQKQDYVHSRNVSVTQKLRAQYQ